MIGKIIGVFENSVEIELTLDIESRKNLVNFHVVFEDGSRKVVGEVTSLSIDKASIVLLGEIHSNVFVPGVIKKPFFGASCRYINSSELAIIVGNTTTLNSINIGNMPQYNDYQINVDVNKIFSGHLSILGNTGSGKSHGLSRLIQNMFIDPVKLPKKSNIFVFDAYGEYNNALSKNKNIKYKLYTTKVSKFEDINCELLRIPLWLLDVDDYALILEANKITQLPIIEKALKLVEIFAKEEDSVIEYKDDIIARALIEILYGGGTPMQIRDQIFAVLSSFNTKNLNLESKIIIPGWVRTLRQCLIIDKDGKIQDIQLVAGFFNSFVRNDLELSSPDGSFPYNLNHLKDAFDFALISEGILKSDKVYDETNVLKVRLHSLINSDYKEFFNYENYISKEQYIKKLVTDRQNNKCQVVNFNINYVDDRFAKILVKLISKMVFEYNVSLENRASFPVHLFLEEAHRYVQNDNDINVLGYNIFERISKEGRKYAVILGMISQRPSEISETAISQCTNFLVFRMQHPKDLNYLKEMIPNVSEETLNKFKILQPGTFMAFGSAFKIPLLLKMDMPDPAPYSQNADIDKLWYE